VGFVKPLNVNCLVEPKDAALRKIVKQTLTKRFLRSWLQISYVQLSVIGKQLDYSRQSTDKSLSLGFGQSEPSHVSVSKTPMKRKKAYFCVEKVYIFRK
jgi:hypothetical protein